MRCRSRGPFFTRKMVAFGPPDRDGHRLPPPVRAHQSSAPLKTVTASASPHGCRERTGKKGGGKSWWRHGKSSRTVQGPTRAARHSRGKTVVSVCSRGRVGLVRSDSQEKIGAQWRGWGEKRGASSEEQLSPRDTEWSQTLGRWSRRGHRRRPPSFGGGHALPSPRRSGERGQDAPERPWGTTTGWGNSLPRGFRYRPVTALR